MIMEYEVTIAENEELKQIISDLEEEIRNLEGQLDKTRAPLNKDEAKLLGTIHKCKIELKKQPLKKSGYNNHNRYSYFELSDFLSCLEVILDNHGLGSYCYFEDGKGYLVIFDVATGMFHSWDTPCRLPSVKENGFDVGVYMKAEQAVQTYARRTLYLQAFDIVEPNDIESDGSNKPKPKPQPKKKPPVKKQVQQATNTVVKPIIEPKEDEITEQDVNEMLDKVYDIIVNKGGKKFNIKDASWQLDHICKNPQLLSACKNALKTYTADKIAE